MPDWKTRARGRAGAREGRRLAFSERAGPSSQQDRRTNPDNSHSGVQKPVHQDELLRITVLARNMYKAPVSSVKTADNSSRT